ncbi:hypothetical protein, partial [Vibrio parahaemolyticus]
QSEQITLENFAFKGKNYSVTIDLPEVSKDETGYYSVENVTMNEEGHFHVTLGALVNVDSSITLVSGVKPYA